MVTASGVTVAGEKPAGRSLQFLWWSGAGLVAASWISAAFFGVYILAFYLAAIPAGHLAQWNENLSGLYTPHHLAGLLAMSAHLATGAVILLLGPIQLLGSVRRRWPALHRWLGRVYIVTAVVAGFGGLGFILSQGTIGGVPMDAGFGLYGVLMLVAAVETYRYARAGHYDRHRAWALRLFALAIGSWLYRMDYGFWLTAAHRLGHREDFRGPFDVVMAFFFFLPNLAVVEIFLRGRGRLSQPGLRLAAAAAMNVATLIVLLGSYYFVRFYWGPAIVNGLLGRAEG